MHRADFGSITFLSSGIGREGFMEDLTWIAVMLALFAATILYVRLCENA